MVEHIELPRQRWRGSLLLQGLLTLSVAAAALVGCGGVATYTVETPALTPQEWYSSAVEATTSGVSYRAEVEEVHRVPHDDFFFVDRRLFDWVYVSPSELEFSAEIVLEAPTGKTTLHAGAIVTGGTIYALDPESGEWSIDTRPVVAPADELDRIVVSAMSLEFGPDTELRFGPDIELEGPCGTPASLRDRPRIRSHA